MDLIQRKLTKSEWNSIEKPIDKKEKEIVNMIIKGFYDIDIRSNENYSLMNYMKITEDKESMHYTIYKNYFLEKIKKITEKYEINYKIPNNKDKNNRSLKKVDSFKIENCDKEFIENNSDTIFEFVMLDILSRLYRNYKKKNKNWILFYYTLCHMNNNTITLINTFLKDFQEFTIELFKQKVNVHNLIANSCEYIEKNSCLLHFSDISLYSHQKELFNIFNKQNTSSCNLVLYIAPTATGKTLSPLALSEKYKIIFVCAARHVGMALSKYAISASKKVAFGFGCESPSDIRLHFGAASKYVKHDRTGTEIKYKDGTKKVDN